MSIEEAKQKIAELVAKYESLSPSEVKSFNEANTKQGFIEPLFRALGWNVDDTNEVTLEEKASNGRVDYAFKLNGVSQFYLETKALRADLTRPEYVKQVITYAYNKGITWAVLTDFEGLQVYNAQTGHSFITLSYDNYLRDFDDLWLLSKESFQTNALNEKAEKYGVFPPRLGIEQRLYNQLRQWREDLSNQLHLHNEHLSVSQIDEVIQRLFNRLIFIRNCEDRRIEDRVLLSAVNEWRGGGRKGELIERLRGIFRDFDGYYDSDLFAYHLTDEVFIEGTTIEHIIDGLYQVVGGMANYDFSIIDADVLGAVYEQYLGHVATIVKQRAKDAQARMDLGLPTEETFEITAKKQRRKEHGIYYTPKFVTNYIVKETVGRFLKERSYNEILNIKILDPACGSGSFLIRAYDELLSYHAYQRNKPVSEFDQWERLPILTNNIFGVDLDIQAVEIAQLNLLLRSLAKRETLPSLADNIRQGNSLISGAEEELKGYFGDNWHEKKSFNWEQEFKDIMANGRFDVVIGNPPWGGKLTVREQHFAKEHFNSVSIGGIDTYKLFIQKGIELLKTGGMLGLIVPNTFLTQTTYQDLRKYLLQFHIYAILNLGENIFGGMYQGDIKPTNPCCVIVIEKLPPTVDSLVLCLDLSKVEDGENKGKLIQQKSLVKTIPQGYYHQTPFNNFYVEFSDTETNLMARLGQYTLLRDVQHFKIKDVGINYNKSSVSRKVFYKGEQERSPDFNFIKSGHIWRYRIDKSNNFLRANYLKLLDEGEKISFNKLVFDTSPKLVLRQTSDCPIVAVDEEKLYLGRSVIAIAETGVAGETERETLSYLMAILNSRLLKCYYQNLTREAGRTFAQVKVKNLMQLPIRCIDFDKPTEKKLHDDLVVLVDKMLELNKRLAPIRDTYCNERDELLREIKRTDAEIDQKVYELYGLTEEERQVVEASL